VRKIILAMLCATCFSACGSCGGATNSIIKFLDLDVPDGISSCEIDCLGRVHGEVQLDCNAMQRNSELARSLLVGNGVIEDGEYCAFFSGFDILIAKEEAWDNWRGERLDGEYYWYNYAKLGPDCDSLLHEMLHHFQLVHNHNLDPGHPNWEKNGWNALDQEYDARSERVDISMTTP
jgi:hypothetical protein